MQMQRLETERLGFNSHNREIGVQFTLRNITENTHAWDGFQGFEAKNQSCSYVSYFIF